MGEGKPQSQAETNVAQTDVQTNDTWNTGTPKTPSDAEAQGVVDAMSDKHAGDGAATSTAQQVASTLDPRAERQGGDAINPSSFGGLKDGLPASGAPAAPDKTVDADKKI
ncbi:hypothetical protein QR90_11310 [Deinococcus radiopugnans]|uniref:Uncharacterized protein n=1 Tax=Deinococcus radiopugnans TaxID=57497 RepID=A0A0A7KJW9_9DEIO|nr:hypothetical protein [Deinococcus radiopugnans]AIZ45544.1 hypothetical protein QR90_11310 [Deinococcus radiopugnans]